MKALTAISQGTKKSEGLDWHWELQDKVQSLQVHANYSIRNCDQDPEKLQALLLNPVHQYQHQHDGCPTTSRCRVDPNYEPSKVVLRSPVAIKLLQNAIERCNLYKVAL